MTELAICTNDRQAMESERIFCSYCGQPVYVPWMGSNGQKLDGFNCLEAQRENGECVVRLALDTATQMGKALANSIQKLPKAEDLDRYFRASFGGVTGKAEWDGPQNTVSVRWGEDVAPSQYAPFSIDVRIRLMQKYEKGRMAKDQTKQLEFSYPVQPAGFVTIDSVDPRFSKSKPIDGAQPDDVATAPPPPRMTDIVAPNAMAARFAFTLGSESGPLGDEVCEVIITARDPIDGIAKKAGAIDRISASVRLTPTIENGRLQCELDATQWRTLLGQRRPGSTSVLVVSLKKRQGELYASTMLVVEHVLLRFTILHNEPKRFVFDDDASWVCHGVPHILRTQREGAWAGFDIALVPDEKLAQLATFEVENSGEQLTIRGRLSLRCACNADNVPKTGEYELKIVPCSADRTRRKHVNPDLVLEKIRVQIVASKREPIEVLAIDFGTTNTASAMCRTPGGRIETVTTSDKKDIPTTLYYWVDGDEIDLGLSLIGESANLLYEDKPSQSRYFSGFKTKLIQSVLGGESEPYEITPRHRKTPEMLCEDFLYLYFKTILSGERIDGRAIRELVCTFPVDTPRSYRERLLEVVTNALTRLGVSIRPEGESVEDDEEPHGVAVREAMDEATSGGWWWWYQKRFQHLAVDTSETLLVYDYGGGTTDISLLRFTRTQRGYEVRILGVAGGKTCGGDDVTWRLAREFVFASERAVCDWVATKSELSRRLLDVATRKIQNRRIWRDEIPSMVYMIEKMKRLGIGTETNSDDKVLEWEGLTQYASDAPVSAPTGTWYNLRAIRDVAESDDDVQARAKAQRFLDTMPNESGRIEHGRCCAVYFDDRNHTYDATGFYGADDREISDDQKRKVVHGYFSFDLLPPLPRTSESVLHDALQSLETTERFVKSVMGVPGPGLVAQVDHLLVIGQASRTKIFQHEMLTKFRALARNPPVILERALDMGSEIDPKTCVACGACASALRRRQIVNVPTILRPIVCRCDTEAGVADPNTVLMPSDWERNRDYEALPAVAHLLAAYTPEASALFLDAGYDLGIGGEGRRVFQRVRKNKQDWRASQAFRIAVVDPSCESYRNGLTLSRTGVPKLVNELQAAGKLPPHAQLLVFWPADKKDDIAAYVFRI